MDSRLNQSWWALKLSFGVVPIVAGLDKFFNLLTDWEQYLSPLVARIIPASTFLHGVGIIEIAAGLLVLSKLTRVGAYLVSAWLVGIALNLLTTGKYFDIAVRDLVMAVGAFTLARLSEVRAPASARERPRTEALKPAHGHV
ncbi:DoxX-like protein [Archangium gephyra]|uniref:DoxX-like protein n=1 Tax=Archangium gephyra TaxID=48 RepID=A0AAC8TH30_9BACT|nr:DoxX family protein [Archangium gephyra]AKJ04126.1 Putative TRANSMEMBRANE PROTEIN [Archangium gephyra]REG37791.1 DoxX-like protein [Archangium gephyra]